MKLRLAILTITAILVVSACAPATTPAPTADINAVRTSAAKTVVAEFTLTAAAFSPTPPPATQTNTPQSVTPTVSLTATSGLTTDPTLAALGTPVALCDNYSFDLATLDVTIPDGTQMTPGQDFIKTWKIKNTGNCTWGDGYKLIYSYGAEMDGQPVPLTSVVAPGQEIEVSVNFKAPTAVGEYTSAWQMANPRGIPFGDKDHILFVKIIVQ